MLVSIVINNYNYARYVGEAIDSALRQDHAEVEVVVVDDGSTDDSAEVIRRYGDKISAIFQANGGQGAAINAGFAACRGEVVFFLDADDRLHPGAAGEIVRHFRPGVVKVQFGLDIIDGDGRVVGRPVLEIHPDVKTFLPLLRTFLFYPTPPGSGNAYRRSFLEKTLPMPPEPWRINADSHLLFAAPLAGEIVQVDAGLGDYRRHGDGASRRNLTDVTAFADKEFRKMAIARDYAAGLLGGKSADHYAYPPAYLKLEVAHTVLHHAAGVPFGEAKRLLREAFRTAWGWKPWPWMKRWALPPWVLLACLLPLPARKNFLHRSLVYSGY